MSPTPQGTDALNPHLKDDPMLAALSAARLAPTTVAGPYIGSPVPAGAQALMAHPGDTPPWNPNTHPGDTPPWNPNTHPGDTPPWDPNATFGDTPPWDPRATCDFIPTRIDCWIPQPTQA